jgi:hypothetical protein
MVWPEFEDEGRDAILEGSPIPTTGFASIWIVSPTMRVEVHRQKARTGKKAYFMAGGARLARAEIIEIIGLFD